MMGTIGVANWVRRRIWPFLLVVSAGKLGSRMENFGFWDWMAYGGIVIAALAIALDTAIAQSNELAKHFPRIFARPYVGFLPLVAVALSGGAFAEKALRGPYLQPPAGAEMGAPQSFVQAWGVNNGVFYTIVRSDKIAAHGRLKKLVLVVRASYATVDRMTDKHILTSGAYTITDGLMTLAVSDFGNLDATISHATTIEFNVVEIPFLFSPDQIGSLSDLDQLDGKILATVSESVVFRAGAPIPQLCPPAPVHARPRTKS